MIIPFNKYEGTGNDFIIVRNNPRLLDHNDNNIFKRLCNRRFGIGADGLILIEDSPGYDFKMLYYNADGSPGEMCGNGGRCAAHFVMKHLTAPRNLSFLAGDGPHTARSAGDDIIEISVRDVRESKETPDGIMVNTGVPHLVIFTDDTERADFVTFARGIRYSSRYAPEGVNVNLVRVTDNGLVIRTYERGVEDETLSCGTGATASAIAAALTGKIVTGETRVSVRGGELHIRFVTDGAAASEVYLTGPATFVFSGETEIL
ncbi:MAG: diaminopimelate epimerase [Bacteroidales bacterium]|nr:diaminopimelate epimerase [Bacteroidales bacterium]MDT8373960.1 diaminopimelate epimerase [Bacteroidales bacterium]